MAAVEFSCEATFSLTPREIAARILDLSNWPQFRGYWPIPGIKQATFEVRTPEVVGTRIRVVNTDGSRHVEEITVWDPEHHIQMQMTGFSPPLSYLATSFVENWRFRHVGDSTEVVRAFELNARKAWAKLPLRLIATFLKRAIERQQVPGIDSSNR